MTDTNSNHKLDACKKRWQTSRLGYEPGKSLCENLPSLGFNFPVIYSLTIAGFINSKTNLYAEIILIHGAIICFCSLVIGAPVNINSNH